MYESVIWVGFGCVLFAIIFELKERVRYFLTAGVAGGFLCLVLMDLVPVLAGNSSMPGFENQINPLQPVLQNNFWLMVHVLTITLSYAAFGLAWILAHVTLVIAMSSPQEHRRNATFHLFIYRVLQVGVLLLTVGTILGGVWAYYSWGRFWGWDPKETWAFISLVLYLVVLHGRFAGIWSNFALSIGSVVCFLSIVMAWYGVNFVLGSGLHAYGSGAGGLLYAGIFTALDLAFVAVAILIHHANKQKSAVPLTTEV
jgi:ABC-type transport system involved in cytochrome c biogenesis permease subunit